MDSYLVIDGYNILNCWPKLAEMMRDSLEDARDRLVYLLNNYAGFKNYKIILVFDGHNVKDNRGERSFHHNVEVVFSPEGVSADRVIEKEVGRLLKNGQVFVATSDKLQQEIIWTKGAYRISARELVKDIEQAQAEYREIINPRRSLRRNYLESNLNQDVREALERIRRNQGK